MPSPSDHLRFLLTAHATTVIAEWGINSVWIERVLAAPGRTEPDRDDPSRRHALGRIADRDGRVLRVVY